MGRRRAVIANAIPELSRVCSMWSDAPWQWATPLSAGWERKRSIGASKVISRGTGGSFIAVKKAGRPKRTAMPGEAVVSLEGELKSGREVRGRVLGSSTPAHPTLAELLRAGHSLCERGTVVEADDYPGSVLVVQSRRLRELNRKPRAVEPGFSVTAPDAVPYLREMRAALDDKDIARSDSARGGTLPYPHRAGSSPCSGPRRPAAITEALRSWREGDAYDNATENDMLALARSLLPKRHARVSTLEGVERAALEVEEECVALWELWARRNTRRIGDALTQTLREVRARYPRNKKKKPIFAR